MAFAIQQHRHADGLSLVRLCHTGVRVGLHLGSNVRARSEALGVHTVLRHTGFDQRSLGRGDHGFRATDKHFVHAARRQQGGHQRTHLVSVNTALQQVHFLRLAREDVDHGESVGKAVLEVLQGFIEHHAGHAPVTVHQGEFGVGLFFQGGGCNRQDGGDTRARCKTHAMNGALLLDGKTAIGWHHLQCVSRTQMAGGPIGKNTAFYRADTHFKLPGPAVQASRAADGIGAPHILAVDGGAQGQKLAGLKLKSIAQCRGYCKGNGSRLGRLGGHTFDNERVEMGR